MQVHKGKAPGSGRLARTGVELSRDARVRLAWIDFYRGSQNAAHTCRHFGISRQTFYRWQRRYDQLKQQGRLVEPPRSDVPGSRRALRPRPYAVRKPKQYAVSQPGDLVEVDTLDVRPLPGVVFKQFTARDVISRWDVIQAHTRATAQTAAQFLDTLQLRMPFPIRAVQVDGGSEFAAEFELACSAACTCSFFPRALPNSMAPSNAPTAPTPRSSIRSLPARWK